jgi:hypothetical protein
MTGEKGSGEREVKIRLLPKIIFLLPGTFFHELAHYLAAIVFGKPAGFSVIPRISAENLILGNVRASTRFKVFSSFIAVAPLVWWLVLYLLLAHFRVVRTAVDRPLVHFTLSFGSIGSFSLMNMVLFWLAIELFWAGRLSAQDIKTFFAGLFSVSGLFLAVTITTLIFVMHYFHPPVN